MQWVATVSLHISLMCCTAITSDHLEPARLVACTVAHKILHFFAHRINILQRHPSVVEQTRQDAPQVLLLASAQNFAQPLCPSKIAVGQVAGRFIGTSKEGREPHVMSRNSRNLESGVRNPFQTKLSWVFVYVLDCFSTICTIQTWFALLAAISRKHLEFSHRTDSIRGLPISSYFRRTVHRAAHLGNLAKCFAGKISHLDSQQSTKVGPKALGSFAKNVNTCEIDWNCVKNSPQSGQAGWRMNYATGQNDT